MNNIVCYDSKGNIINGFVQWDADQTIMFKGLDLTQAPIVHFANRESDTSLGVQSTIDDSGNITAVVPNILLQNDLMLYIYIFVPNGSGGRTIRTISIPVQPKPKPDDYIYTENTDVIYLENLVKQVEDLQQQIIDGTDIEVVSDSDTEYKLKLSINGKEITTANLKGANGSKGDKGDPGAAATISIGETTTGEPGTQASVTNTGTETAAVLNFTIPQGEKGEDYIQVRTPLSLAEHSSRANPLNVFSLADGAYEITEEGWIGNGEDSRATAEMLKGSIFIKYDNAVNIITESCYYVRTSDEKWNDLYLPTYAEVETMTQNALGIITPSTSTSLALRKYYEYRYADAITELNLTIDPRTNNEDFTAALIFKSGAAAPTISYSSDDFKFVGDDCDSAGDFIPQPNTGYEISFKQLGYGYIVARVGAFPI